MQGDLIIIAVGLVVALAFSTLIKAFTDNIITPLVNAAGGGAAGEGLGWTINGQRIDLGAFISAIIYFIIFMAFIYFVIVVPYRAYMRREPSGSLTVATTSVVKLLESLCSTTNVAPSSSKR